MRSLTLCCLALCCWSEFSVGPACAAPANEPVWLFSEDGANLFVSTVGGAGNWPVVNGALVSTPNTRRSNNLVSQLHFRDAQIELEFLLPHGADGNSGVFLHGLYEVQILASGGKRELTKHDLGAVYGLYAPMVNADLGPGKWQTLKVVFHAPRRDETGALVAKGSITAWLNNKQIHDSVKIGDATSKYNPYEYDTTPYLAEISRVQNRTNTGPLLLQDHDCAVQFRRVRVTPFDDAAYIYAPPKQRSPVHPESALDSSHGSSLPMDAGKDPANSSYSQRMNEGS